MEEINLQNKRIMITRPVPMGEVLCQEIDAANGKSVYLPSIEIHPPHDSILYPRQLTKVDSFDWLIFISPQAISSIKDLLKEQWPVFPERTKIAAVGGGTAKALERFGFHVQTFPSELWSSEGLLDLPEFRQNEINGKRVALVRGEGGRETLDHSLKARGAIVSHIIVYRREKPDINVDVFIKMLKAQEIDYVVSTSSEGLRNLCEMLEPAVADLRSTQLVVISQHMSDAAKELGFAKIILAKNPSRGAIIEALHHSISHE